jgi:hypothetical protein
MHPPPPGGHCLGHCHSKQTRHKHTHRHRRIALQAFAFSPTIDYIVDVAPTLVTGRYATDSAKRAVMGDSDFGRDSVSHYWAGELATRKAVLKGSSSITPAEALKSFPTVCPMRVGAARLKDFPPIIIEVHGVGLCWGYWGGQAQRCGADCAQGSASPASRTSDPAHRAGAGTEVPG